MITLRRVLPFAPLVLVMLAWAGLGGLTSLHENSVPRPQSLPPLRRVVVLLVPGLDADDWNNWRNDRRFVDFAEGSPAAIAPVSAQMRRPHVDTLSPDSRLLLACETVLGKNINWGQLLHDAKGRAVVLDASGVVAPVVFGSGVTATGNDAPPVTWSTSVPEAAGGEATDPARFAQNVRAAFMPAPSANTSASPVLVVAVLDDLFRADTYAPFCSPEAARKARQAALDRVGAAVNTLTSDGNGDTSPTTLATVLLVAPLPPALGKPENERQGLIVLWNVHDQRKTAVYQLTSPSTRHTPGMATFGDVPQALASLLRLSPQAAQAIPGRSLELIRTAGGGTGFERQQKRWAAQWRETRFLVALPWILSGLLLASVYYAERKPSLSAACALFACTLPVALWIAAAAPLLFGEASNAGVGYGLAAFFAGSVALLAFLFRKRNIIAHALQCVAGFTVFLLALDTVLGGPLLGRSPLSFSPLEGARFYGVGNESAGVFLGAGLFCAGRLASGRPTFWARLGGGLGVVALLGLPTLGANVGGALAAVAGWGSLLVWEVPAPHRKKAALIAAFCSVLLLAGLAGWESHRPPSAQTHLGQVLTQTQTTGANGAAVIARRKIAMNAHLAVSSPWSVLLFTEVGLCVYLWRNAKASGAAINQSGAIALFVGAGAAFAANDSGVVMAAACLLFAPPLLLCLTFKQDG